MFSELFDFIGDFFLYYALPYFVVVLLFYSFFIVIDIKLRALPFFIEGNRNKIQFIHF